jgi:hypothetical protein
VNTPGGGVTRVLIVSRDAGRMSDAVQRAPDAGLPAYEQVSSGSATIPELGI